MCPRARRGGGCAPGPAGRWRGASSFKCPELPGAPHSWPCAPPVLGGGDCVRRAAVLCRGHAVCSGLRTASLGGRRSRTAGRGPGSGGRCLREKGSGLCLGMWGREAYSGREGLLAKALGVETRFAQLSPLWQAPVAPPGERQPLSCAPSEKKQGF